MLKQSSVDYDYWHKETDIRKGWVAEACSIVMHVCVCSTYVRARQQSDVVC